MKKAISYGGAVSLAISLVILMAWVGTLYAQSSTNYRIEVDVIAGGGGLTSSTNYVLSSVIGQPSGIGLQSSTSYTDEAGYTYAWLGSIPIYGLVDFDGDRKSDITVWRPGDGYWYIISSKDGSIIYQQWGGGAFNDVPVPGDYDGDGKTDIAVWRPGDGVWYIKSSKDGSIIYRDRGGHGELAALSRAPYLAESAEGLGAKR